MEMKDICGALMDIEVCLRGMKPYVYHVLMNFHAHEVHEVVYNYNVV